MTRAVWLAALVCTGLACTGALLSGCSGETARASTVEAATAGSRAPALAAGPSIFDELQSAALTTAYSGTRRLWSRAESAGRVNELEYREHVDCDGAGGFAIEAKDVQRPHVSAAQFDVFQLLQKGHEAFLFRYRDFHVRDVKRMLRNYTVDDTGQSVVVAGRPCDVLVFERAHSHRGRPAGGYRVAVDAATKLVLRTDEFDARGATVATMEYESITFAPPPATTVYHADLPATAFDPSLADTRPVLGFALHAPTLVQDFELARSERIDLQGRVWARLLYHDGIEPFFFMQSGERAPEANDVSAHLPGHAAPAGADGMPVVRVFETGTWTIAQCSIDGAEYIVAGKASEGFLVAALQSALR